MRRKTLITAASLLALMNVSLANQPLTLSVDKTATGPGDEFTIQIQGCPGDLVLLLASPTLGPTTLPKIGTIQIGTPSMQMVFGPLGPSGTIDAPCDLPCVQTVSSFFTAHYQAVSADPSIPWIPITDKSNVISITYDPELYRDCNGNGNHDACDIRDGISLDIDMDGVPDECVDCDMDGNPDGPNVAGRVWHDLACDGIEDPEDPGVPDVIVTAYDNNDMVVGGTMTDDDGEYTLVGVANLGGVRVEFTEIPSYLVVAPAAKGLGKETQFITDQRCDADLALIAPAELCPEGDDACLATPCYINGDPLAGGTAGSLDVLVRFPYKATGTGQNTYLADGVDIGATWGLAYQRSTDSLFAASFLKRHVGFGPGGIDAIYRVDEACFGTPSPANVSTWLNVNTLPGVNVGTVVRPDLPANFDQPSFDADAYAKIGEVGLGGLPISEDDRRLYAVNLASNEVLEIDVASKTLLNRYSATTGINCTNGEARAFAVATFRDAVYVGVTCTAENGGTKQDLMAHIRRLDGGVFVDVLSFPMDYQRAFVYGGCPAVAGFFPWLPDNLFPPPCGIGSVVWPQPMLSSIEFDNDGTMAMGFIDRFGHQTGVANLTLGGATLVEGFSGGDLLRARLEGGVWTLENNGTSGSTTAGAGNNQGPGGGEFYFDDQWKVNGMVAHNETSLGGVAILPGSGEVANTVFDPINGTQAEIRTGGVRRYDSTTGDNVNEYKVYDLNQPGTFGKAAGLGDLALLCSGVPLEIGDRVFLDDNKDGIQETDDAGIAGVTVDLYRGGAMVATTTTDAQGNFVFVGLVPNDDTYEVRISTSQAALAGLVPTAANVGNDLADSDGDPSLVAGFSTAPFSTGGPGRNDFSIDFGFQTP